jgi:O-antigen ligase
MTVLVVAAMPVRISGSFPVVDSVSVLDILLVIAAATLMLDLAFRPVDTGYRELFLLLCVPLVLSTVSIVWSQDRPATVRASLIFAEGLIAYLFVVRELAGLSPVRVITYIRRYAYLLILPGVLLLLHVPGFGPQGPDLKETSGDYLGYFTRLSHPVLGRSNNLATVLAFFVPLLFYWGHSRHDRRFTRAGFVTVLAIFLTLSRGVLLAFLVAGVLYALLASGRRRDPGGGLGGKVTATVALGAIAIAVFYSVNPATRELFDDRLTLANVESRSDLISLSSAKIADRPLLGYGAGVAPDHDRGLEGGVHNAYLQQVVYFGLPLGLVVSLALCATAAVFLARRRSSALAGVIAYTVMVQLVIFLFESSFEGTLLRVLFYLSMGMAAALLRSVEVVPPPMVGRGGDPPRRPVRGRSDLARPRLRVAGPSGQRSRRGRGHA